MSPMKKILKHLLSFLVGALIGAVLVVASVALFGEISLAEFGRGVARMGVLTIAACALAGVLLMFFCLFLQVLLHEAGHLVCGLLSGYRFLSFRVFSLTIVAQDGRLRLKRYKLAGTGGQCLLAPPGSPDDRVPYFWYYAGGVAANLLSALLALGLWAWVDGMPFWLRLFLLLFGLMGLLLAALNGIPAKMGGLCNDACNIVLLRRRPADLRYMWIQLTAAALIQTGTSPRSLPDEWFPSSDTAIDYSDLMQVSIPLMQASRLQDSGRWDEACTLLDGVYAHRDQLLGLLRLETEAELIFTLLMLGRTDRARSLWTEQLKTYVTAHSRTSSAKQRILFAVARCLDADEARANSILADVCRRRDDYLMQGEATMDIRLMEELAEKCRISAE